MCFGDHTEFLGLERGHVDIEYLCLEEPKQINVNIPSFMSTPSSSHFSESFLRRFLNKSGILTAE